MKQHIAPEDLFALSESQKLNLRDMWMPEVNTIACASICRDVINEEFETIVFMIGQIIINEGSRNLILRKMSLPEDIAFEDELSEQDIEENRTESSDENDDNEFELEYAEPDQYFSREDCLPLLSIGCMIEILNGLKYGQDGFTITIPPLRKLLGDKGYAVTNKVELQYEEEELCDALWSALKEFL